VLERLPRRPLVRRHVELLLESYDPAVSHESLLRQRLRRLAGRIEVIRRFTTLPGVAWVWGSTFYAYVDTPWRFRSKQALWKYIGIGLERRRSGGGRVKQLDHLGVPRRCSFPLKYAMLGAARSAAAAGNNPFADQYERWLHNGRAPHIARRNVARSLSAVMWGMWKNQTDYRPEWVGRSARELAARA
jgi:transposase